MRKSQYKQHEWQLGLVAASLVTLPEALGRVLVQSLSECRLAASLLPWVLLQQSFLFLEKTQRETLFKKFVICRNGSMF